MTSLVPSKPRLLYLSPVLPATTGNGLAMRAGMVLEALAEQYEISLLVRKIYPSSEDQIAPRLAECCRQVEIVAPKKSSHSAVVSSVKRMAAPSHTADPDPYRTIEFDVLHVFRLIMVPLASRLREDRAARPTLHLDFDDVESRTHTRLAALCRQNGDAVRALVEDGMARRAEVAENDAFPRCDRIYVCSETDKSAIEHRAHCDICVLPNAVRPPTQPSPAEEHESFRLLFVGTLGYYPNEDAALHLCREIVPRLRQMWLRPFSVDIVGAGASSRLRAAAADAGVTLRGLVPDLESSYRSATIVVVPIRAGGGTRIKIIEAFSHQRPVVSSSVGAEGLDARHEQEILIANDADAFCRACLRLVEDRDLRNRIVRNAHELCERSYSLQAMRRTLGSLGRT